MEKLELKVQRFDPSAEDAPRLQSYSIPLIDGMTVLDALLYAKRRIDHGISMRFSCRMASCGSCGMKINGRPRLACETQLAELGEKEVKVQPMDNFPIVRDLVVDLEGFFADHSRLGPGLKRRDAAEQESPSGEYLMKPDELDTLVQFTNCIKCGLCTSACPTRSTDSRFPGPQALAQVYRYLEDPRDEGGDRRLEVVDSVHGVWRCHFAGSCSAVCPKGVDPALGIQLLKRHVMSGRRRRQGSALFPNPNEGLLKRD